MPLSNLTPSHLPTSLLINLCNQDILAVTSPEDPDFNSVQSMLKALGSVAKHITLSRKAALNIKKLFDIERSLVGLEVSALIPSLRHALISLAVHPGYSHKILRDGRRGQEAI